MTEAFMPLMRHGLDPVPGLAERQRNEPVSKLEFPFGITAWLVTGYQDVQAVIGDTTRFSNDFSNVVASTGGQATAAQDPGGLGFSDPPQHTKLRRALTPEFTMRRLSRLVPRIEQIVEQQLDVMQASGPPVDLVQAFAMPVPSLVICELLDVPYPDRADFQRLSGSRFDILGGAGPASGWSRETACSACSSGSTATRSPIGNWPGWPTACWSAGTRRPPRC